ncbi:MAG: sulfatase-like hydrolase/transferase [Oryzomonas sp.]|uniref:sulfatase-like hydrolase/transferase n=1 Tax=Oryzomonas sp. TaxID=2855186 RepID=UPI002843F631|nr:sulfatase-like hydrolase/transferase [Oryzomonas sp.]MDR3580280.1 sulfatase-like hydrolase/transferase [Oryzomonas sp.]
MRSKINLRDFLACLSLANLIMLKVWLQLFPFNSGKSFWLAHSPANSYLAAMINTVLIGLGLWCAVVIANRWRGSAMVLWPFIYGVTLCLALNGIRVNYGWGRYYLYRKLGEGGPLLAGITVILLMTAIALLMIRHRHLISQHYFRVPLVLAPFVLVTFGQSALALRQLEPPSAFVPHTRHDMRRAENTHAMPVVWIIFDELDYRIAFGQRPKGLVLPELDRLQQTSLNVTRAYSPFDSTAVSIPALLTGKTLKRTKPLGAGDMTLSGTDGTTSSLQQTETTIFADMHNRGARTAIFGWYFPYSRLFSAAAVVKDYPIYLFPTSERLTKTIVFQLGSLVESSYFSPFGDSLAVINHIAITTSIQKDVLHYLQTNQNGGFAFLHYPVPHDPNIYNRNTHRYGSNSNIKEGYLDNVALTDRLLGEIRTIMEKAGTWDKALIIVSADHHWRQNTYDGIIDKRHVPFLVKLPHQTQGTPMDSRFETVRTRDMIVRIVDGTLKTPEDVKRWMSQ